MTIDYTRLYLDGRWCDPSTSATITVRAAATGEPLGSVPAATEDAVDAAVAAARRQVDDPAGWSRWAPVRRQEALERFAVELEKRAEETARRVSQQNGMPITVARRFEAGFPALRIRRELGPEALDAYQSLKSIYLDR